MNSSLIPESPEEQNLLLGEHALGLLDPEREAEVRAWIERDDNAARMALRGDGQHFVSLDKVIRTMRQTGADMNNKYKETARGGLAVNIVEC